MLAFTSGLKAADSQMAQYQQTLGITAPSEDEGSAIEGLQLAAWGNSAICCLKLGQGRKALEHATKVLEKDASNGKAIFNSGRALIMVGELEQAQTCLENALAKNPEDKLIKKELARIPKEKAKQKEKDKRTWQAAFKKM